MEVTELTKIVSTWPIKLKFKHDSDVTGIAKSSI